MPWKGTEGFITILSNLTLLICQTMTSIGFKCAKINYILDKQYSKHTYDEDYKSKR